MKPFNVIIIYSEDEKSILMCQRKKPPYKGLKNLIGGKIEPNEESFTAAYRELYEETHISSDDIELHHIMDFAYHLSDIKLEVYAGKLNKQVDIYGDENELEWVDLKQNFFDYSIYAGEGNIGHMLEQVKIYRDRILK